MSFRFQHVHRPQPLVYLALILFVALSVGFAACEAEKDPTDLRDGTIRIPTPTRTVDDRSRIERGEYLVTIGGCNDCHTPLKMGPKGPEPDMTRMLSGHPEDMKMPAPPKLPEGSPWMIVSAATNTAHAGPWGISYTKNLTPDTLTGIGFWTEEMFIKTIRSGKHFGVGRPIMPPMPWFNYAKGSDDDLKAIYAYLRTIPPIVNHVPEYEPPTPTPAP
jgi:mono/diheme cytochrome c family protein